MTTQKIIGLICKTVAYIATLVMWATIYFLSTISGAYPYMLLQIIAPPAPSAPCPPPRQIPRPPLRNGALRLHRKRLCLCYGSWVVLLLIFLRGLFFSLWTKKRTKRKTFYLPDGPWGRVFSCWMMAGISFRLSIK